MLSFSLAALLFFPHGTFLEIILYNKSLENRLYFPMGAMLHLAGMILTFHLLLDIQPIDFMNIYLETISSGLSHLTWLNRPFTIWLYSISSVMTNFTFYVLATYFDKHFPSMSYSFLPLCLFSYCFIYLENSYSKLQLKCSLPLFSLFPRTSGL